MAWRKKEKSNEFRIIPMKIISLQMSACFQILQLQMNDYKYHYLFTTFVSTLGPGEVDGTRIHASRKRDPSLCSRISRRSTSRTSSTISSISLPSVWSTRRTSVCGVSWGTWSDISRPGIRFSTNRELYRWVKNFRVIENLFFSLWREMYPRLMFARSVIALLPIYIRARSIFIYVEYRFARLNGCVYSHDCSLTVGWLLEKLLQEL